LVPTSPSCLPWIFLCVFFFFSAKLALSPPWWAGFFCRLCSSPPRHVSFPPPDATYLQGLPPPTVPVAPHFTPFPLWFADVAPPPCFSGSFFSRSPYDDFFLSIRPQTVSLLLWNFPGWLLEFLGALLFRMYLNRCLAASRTYLDPSEADFSIPLPFSQCDFFDAPVFFSRGRPPSLSDPFFLTYSPVP